MFAHARLVLGNDCLQLVYVEHARIRQCLSAQRRLDPFPERSPEPGAQRYGKSHLGTVEDVIAEMRFQRFLENILPFAATQLERGRKPRRPFDEFVIEQRHTHFQRMCHARPVDLGQNIARQIGLEIGVLHAGRMVVGRRICHDVIEHLPRVVPLEIVAKRIAVDGLPDAVVQHGHAVEKTAYRIAPDRLKGRFRPQRFRRPIHFRIGGAEKPEERLADRIG